ncbi:hypothetical protein ACFV0R_00285 [Streptomyces sp. NPDC059578]|uniref:hypothetical protein n=1 Tax=unclassified Streptomyces TaxID=2593676 RepID=UPI0036462FFB
MRHLWGFLGFVALVQGAMGLTNELGWGDWGLLRHVAFLDGYELFASIALLLFAFALFGVAESMKKQGK